MFIGEYDYDLDMQVKAEEAREEGLAKGLDEGMQKKAVEDALLLIKDYKAAPEVAAEKMNAPLELVLEALKK